MSSWKTLINSKCKDCGTWCQYCYCPSCFAKVRAYVDSYSQHGNGD